MKKILFIAVFNPQSTNVSQADGLRKCGCEVIEFDYRKAEKNVGSQERDKVIYRLCWVEKPDAVIFSKCNEISHHVVSECNRVSKTVLWYMDPLNNNFNSSLIQKIKLCSLTFCALQEPYKKAKEIGGDKVHFLHEGYDHLSNSPIDLPYKYDYCFIGNPRGWRQKYVKELEIPVIQNAYGEDHSKVVSQTKINLNFTEGGTSDRTYKVLASKGFLLTEPWEGMEEDFIPGKDLDVFNSVEELRSKIDFYLKNEDIRNEISKNGYKTVQKFDRINWAEKILEKI